MNKYVQYDYVPGDNGNNTPKISHHYEYWRPEWKLVNGQIIKPVANAVKEITAKAPESVDVFSCNHCDFISKSESGMKIHVSRAHKN
jgi:hypothetical protein